MQHSNITRPALRYFGSKWRLADWILDHMPAHTCYVEPFGGGCGVLLRKSPSKFEVYNDLDGDVVNFWRMLRERTEEFVNAIELSPYSREEYSLSFEPCEDPLERARRFYIRSRQGHGSATSLQRNGWLFERSKQAGVSNLNKWLRTGHLSDIAQRLRSVQIECDDWQPVISRYDTPETLFFMDPPYVHTSRKSAKEKGYKHEMSDADHVTLSETLHTLKGMAMLCGYPSDLYCSLYGEWRQFSCSTHTGYNRSATEVLWLNARAADRVQHGLDL